MSFQNSIAITHQRVPDDYLDGRARFKTVFSVRTFKENKYIKFPTAFPKNFCLDYDIHRTSKEIRNNCEKMEQGKLGYSGSVKALVEASVQTNCFQELYRLDRFDFNAVNQAPILDELENVSHSAIRLIDKTKRLTQLFSKNYGDMACKDIIEKSQAAYQAYRNNSIGMPEIPIYFPTKLPSLHGIGSGVG